VIISCDLKVEMMRDRKMRMPMMIRICCFFYSVRCEPRRKNSAMQASTEVMITIDKLIMYYIYII
jgi:hypothetical protein